MWKLTSTYRPQLCRVWCICLLFTDAGTLLCLVSFLAIRATRCRHGWWRIHYPSTTQIHYFIFCQFWSNTCCILSICTLHLPYFSMKIRLLISFESPLLCVHCEWDRGGGGGVVPIPLWGNAHSTALLSGNQRRRLQQVAWVCLSWGLFLWFLFIYSFSVFYEEGFSPHGSCSEYQ